MLYYLVWLLLTTIRLLYVSGKNDYYACQMLKEVIYLFNFILIFLSSINIFGSYANFYCFFSLKNNFIFLHIRNIKISNKEYIYDYK